MLTALDLSLGDFDIPRRRRAATPSLGGGDPGQQFIVRELRLPQTLVALLVGAALALVGRAHPDLRPQPAGQPRHPRRHRGRRRGCRVAVIVLGAQRLRRRPRLGLAGVDRGARRRVRRRARHGRPPLRALLAARHRRQAAGAGRHRHRRLPVGGHLVAAGPGPDPGRRERPGLAQRVPQRPRLGARWPAAGDPGRAGADRAAAGAARSTPSSSATTTPAPSACACSPPSCWSSSSPSGLAAVAVSAVGPLEFVAFVAPQIALSLTGGSRPPMLASMVYRRRARRRRRPGHPGAAPVRRPGRPGDVGHRRAVPDLAARPLQQEGDRMSTPDAAALQRRRPSRVGYDADAGRRATSTWRSPTARSRPIIGPNGCGKSTLLRTLGAAAQAARPARSCSTASRSRRSRPARSPSGWRCSPRARSHPRAWSSATSSAAGGTRTSDGSRQWSEHDEDIVAAGARDDRRSPTCATGRSTSSPAGSGSAPGSR